MKTIRNLLILTVLSLFTTATLHAQMTDGKPRFGLKLGVNGANVYDDANASDIKTRVGVTGGAFLQIPLAKGKMALRPELLFSTKGAAYDYLSSNHPDVKINYMEFPLSLEYRLFGFLNLHAGAHASMLVMADGTLDGIKGALSKTDFEKFDYGWQAGAGIDFGSIGVHFRISRGLQKIGKTTTNAVIGDLKNAAWALTVSYGL